MSMKNKNERKTLEQRKREAEAMRIEINNSIKCPRCKGKGYVRRINND